MDMLVMDLLTGTLSETDASDSSDEDDQFIKEPPTKITRIENFVEETVPQYSDAVFQEHFRMCRRVVDFIIGYFAQSAYKAASIGGRDKVSNEKAILLSLWYLANTETFRQVADRFNVSRSAHRCLVRVITFLASIKHEYIVWPCKNEAKHIGEEFEKKQGIKNVIGAIDGCHIRINKPKLNQDSYVNRKGYHSILLQGVMYIVENLGLCMMPDCCVNQHYMQRLQKMKTYFIMFLLGDSAYPCLNWIVPPFKDNGNLTVQQKRFNYKHSSTRICVENAFGLLKGRFRRLTHFENLDMHLIVKCIMACCVLHNLCLKEGDDCEITEVNISEDVSNDPQRQDNLPVNNRREQLEFQKIPLNCVFHYSVRFAISKVMYHLKTRLVEIHQFHWFIIGVA
ncbi:hypothetical protein PPYR_01418 [Photinus pyralis]|uniref:DDE Tnp4 domain-containing protein n=1 Tax=Photinus pyralis TaxID=7054 RepID=A0A5N4B4I7_PHOPY|nr:hypothetical protein PPYR_01418 [Photinus pyralis]